MSRFLSIFSYITLAGSVLATVEMLQHTFTQPGPVSGELIAAEIQPALSALQSVLPKAQVSPALVLACANAVAETINNSRRTT